MMGIFLGACACILLGHPATVAAACAAQDTSRGQVTSSFSVPANGTYRVWSRIKAPDTTNNSYLLEIDGTTCGVVVGDSSSIPANTWTWVNYKNGSTTTPIDVVLTAGSHSMTMIGREDNVQLDRVVFTTDTTCLPTGTGDNCANPPDVTPPTVSISSPATGATVNGTVNVQATAADDVAVSKVEFYVDGVLAITDATSPYTYSLDTTTVSNGAHSLTAKAYDTSNNVTPSTAVSVTVNNPAVCKAGSSTLPTTPGSVTKTGSTYASISMSWSASTPSPGCTLSGYHVFRGGAQIANVTSGTSYTDTGLSASTSYNYTIQAYDSGTNNSNQSGLSNFSTLTDNLAPTIPASFNATAATTASVNLTWTASTDNPNPGGVGVKSYAIYRNGATTPTYTVNGASTASFTDTNVSASTHYTYVITAIDNAINESAPSASVGVTTPAPTCSGTPSVPTNLHGTSQTVGSISFAWTASTASAGCTLSGYHIYQNGVFLADVTSGISHTDSGLRANTSYSYSVAAFDTSGHVSAKTTAVVLATDPDTIAPSAPPSITAAAPGSAQVNLSWTAATDNVGVTNYRIYRGGTLLTTVSGSTLTFSDTTVLADTNYNYQVSALDAVNNESTKTTATPNPIHTPKFIDSTNPTAPSNPTAPVVAAQSIKLNWVASTDNIGVVGYHITLNGVANGDAATNSFTAMCLASGVRYTFTIRAFDASGNVSAPVTVTVTSLNGGLAGDINCDSSVNSTDLFNMLRNWQSIVALPTDGDITGDAKVNATDLFGLLRNWGKSS